MQDTRTDHCKPKHVRESRSFSIDSLLSNTKENCGASGVLEDKWREYIPRHDYFDGDKEISQKNFDLMRHIKSVDYLPWISNASNVLAHREFHEETLNNRADTSYSNLPLPFLYSSWLPVSSALRTNERTQEHEFRYNEFDRVSPREPENSDSDDSKSDSSKSSDSPKDFSCSKRTAHSGKCKLRFLTNTMF